MDSKLFASMKLGAGFAARKMEYYEHALTQVPKLGFGMYDWERSFNDIDMPHRNAAKKDESKSKPPDDPNKK